MSCVASVSVSATLHMWLSSCKLTSRVQISVFLINGVPFKLISMQFDLEECWSTDANDLCQFWKSTITNIDFSIPDLVEDSSASHKNRGGRKQIIALTPYLLNTSCSSGNMTATLILLLPSAIGVRCISFWDPIQNRHQPIIQRKTVTGISTKTTTGLRLCVTPWNLKVMPTWFSARLSNNSSYRQNMLSAVQKDSTFLSFLKSNSKKGNTHFS